MVTLSICECQEIPGGTAVKTEDMNEMFGVHATTKEKPKDSSAAF